MSLAARVAGWDRWRRSGVSVSGPLSPASEASGERKVELFYDEAWQDITGYVYDRDKIVIKRGRSDEAATPDPSTCHLTINNRDGRFSPRNPVSPLYGKIGRNTPLRVSVDQSGTQRFRFYGEISSWPQAWGVAHEDVWTSIEASGILRRLGAGNAPLKSVMARYLTSDDVSDVKAYWPCEDEVGSARIASGLGGPSMKIYGTPNLATYSGFAASAPIPTMGTARFSGKVPAYSGTGETQIRFLMHVPEGGMTTNTVPCRWACTGTARWWQIYYQTGSGGLLALEAFDVDGTNIMDSGGQVFGTGVDGKDVLVSAELYEDGGSLAWILSVLVEGEDFSDIYVGTPTAYTVGRVSQVLLATSDAPLTDCAIGHLSLHDRVTVIDDLSGLLKANTGENPAARMLRLSQEQGVSFTAATGGVDESGNSVTLGYQGVETYVDAVRGAAASDLGLLHEPRDQFGLRYRTRLSLYNQAAALSLDYAAEHISPPFAPVDDDQQTRNDIVVTRSGGSSSRATLESGPLSVLAPPDGVGRYDDSATVSLDDDDQLPDQAGWRLHLGTVDEARYPAITLNLKHPAIANDYDLMAAVLGVDIGDRVTVANPPEWMPPDQISQIVQGYIETIGVVGEHMITINLTPESVYQVGVLDDAALGKLDTAGSELTADITDSATSVSVATLNVVTDDDPLWTTDPAEFPFDITCGGEVMTVTAISGASSPQTFTVTRGINGITKPHPAGTALKLAPGLALAL